jgi:fucose 4-O-acetylase-like acetyltransferase
MDNSDRNGSLTIVKGLFVIFIIIKNCAKSADLYLLHDFVYLFAVPIIFFVSGSLFQEKYFKSFTHAIIKKIKLIYTPFLMWNIFFLIFHNIFLNIGIYCSNSSYECIFRESVIEVPTIGIKIIKILLLLNCEQLCWGIDFMSVLFFTSIFVYILLFIIKKKYYINNQSIVILILIFLLMSMIMQYIHIGLWLFSSISFLSISIYLLGYLLRKLNEKFQLIISSKLIFISSTLILIICALLHPCCITEMTTIFDVPYIFVVSFVGFIWTLNVSQYINKGIPNKIMIFIGNNVIFILAMHLLCFKITNFLIVKYYGLDTELLASCPVIKHNIFIWFILYFITGIAIPIIIKLVLDKLYKNLNTSFKKNFNN